MTATTDLPNELRDQLRSDESVRYHQRANVTLHGGRNEHLGTIVVTDRRILYLQGRSLGPFRLLSVFALFFPAWRVRELAFRQLVRVAVSKKGFKHHLVEVTADGTDIGTLHVVDPEPVTAAIRDAAIGTGVGVQVAESSLVFVA